MLTSYNFTMGPGIAEAIDQANAAGMGVVAMKVMAGVFRRVQPGSPLYEKLKTEGTMVAALKWVLRNLKIHTAIPSITGVDQLEEDRKAMIEAFSPLDEKLLPANWTTLVRFTAGCAASARASAPRGSPWPAWCAM